METAKKHGGKREGAGRKRTTVKSYAFHAPQEVYDILEAVEGPYFVLGIVTPLSSVFVRRTNTIVTPLSSGGQKIEYRDRVQMTEYRVQG